MIYTTYDPSTGQILNVITMYDNNISMLQNKSFVDGRYSAHDCYIDNGQVVSKPRDPSTGVVKYDFDYTTKLWVINTERSIQGAKDLRSLLLQDIDRVNPIWYASLTQEQQQELQTYRQALLDVPQQAGFPAAIEWPTKPTWL